MFAATKVATEAVATTAGVAEAVVGAVAVVSVGVEPVVAVAPRQIYCRFEVEPRQTVKSRGVQVAAVGRRWPTLRERLSSESVYAAWSAHPLLEVVEVEPRVFQLPEYVLPQALYSLSNFQTARPQVLSEQDEKPGPSLR